MLWLHLPLQHIRCRRGIFVSHSTVSHSWKSKAVLPHPGTWCRPSLLRERACGKMNRSIISPSQVIYPNTTLWPGCLGFINMNMNLFSNYLPNILETVYRNIQLERPFSNIWRIKLCHRTALLTDNTKLIRVCKQNLELIKCMSEINNLKWSTFIPRNLYLYQMCLYFKCFFFPISGLENNDF